MAARLQELFSGRIDDSLLSCLEGGELSGTPCYHARSQVLSMEWKLPNVLDSAVYEQLRHVLQMTFHADIQLQIHTDHPQASITQAAGYVQMFASSNPQLRPFLSIHPTLGPDGTLRFASSDPQAVAAMNQAAGALEAQLETIGIGMKIVCGIIQDEPQKETLPVSTPAPAPVHAPSYSGSAQNPSAGTSRKKNWGKQKAEPIAIRDARAGMERISITGRIFSLETRTFNSGKSMQILYISDEDDAIICKRFEGKRFSKDEFDEVRKGDYVTVTGDMAYDSYSRSDNLMISTLEKARRPVRKDDAPEKRTEWHVHSNFSEMDGVCSIESFIQQAWDWGMESIAICDHNVVQAFPMAQHKVEALLKSDPKRRFKVLYGCEMSMVDTSYKIVVNPKKDVLLEDAEYVIFDLETTGLSNRLDDIIEFGAVKMKQNAIIDRRQFFINPHRKLSASITDLTHILQSDVDAARDLEQMLPEIREFIGDAVLVAHNAAFDTGMLNAACRKLGVPEFTNPVIDTLPAAYSMLDLRSYRLGSVCRHYDVPYDGEGAHRADYDAEVLSMVFMAMLRQWGRNATLEDIAALDDSSALRRNHEKHIAVFARNAEGLKELFELVTLSHTKYLKYNPKATSVTGQPRIPRSVLAEYHARGNLLFGSSCQNSEIFDLAHTRSEKELKEAMQFYDFIEVQPLAVYKNLLDAKSIHGIDELKQIVRFIIDAAKELGKPLIATGDCHYVAPSQKRIRDVYINAKAIGNSRHPLYVRDPARRHRQSAPDQHFLTTGEMLNAFDWLDDPQFVEDMVIHTPNQLAQQMEVLYPVKDKLYPPDIEGSDQKLRDICYQTATDWYGDPLPEPVKERLDRELNAIIGAGYYVVYYISHLLVKKSNEDGYLVGSRGSVGSSFVATMSGITEVNPLKPHYICKHCHYLEWVDDPDIHSGFDLPDKKCPGCGEIIRGDGQDIPFETFLGFEGDKVPDIDLNFSGEYQANAHAFTKTIFGDDHVFRAGTVGTVQEKTAYGYVKGFEEEMDLEATPFSEAKRMDLAEGCAGVKRTTGQHPGGIVVVPLDMDVHDFTPVQYPANNPYAEWKTTHFDFHQIHDNILKFDILGHVDPTAMKMLERISGIDVRTIPMNDPDTMKIFSSTESLGLDTTAYKEKTGAAGIPEYGTPFVRGILELTRPTTFAELVSISGLSHGTDVWLNNAKDLIDAGICNLREVIGCRDDIMVDLIRYGLPSKASFTIMESVRKGKGLKPEWEDLMKENEVPEWYMDSCRKIKYMFPKAHAVAYVMMAVRIAWFKVHRPRDYYCQYFSIRCDAYDIACMLSGKEAIERRMYEIEQARAAKKQGQKVTVSDKELAIYDTLELAYEMVMRGYHFSPMSISRSAASEFIKDPEDEFGIIPPFTAVDALGESVARSIVRAREESAFLSKEDLMARTQLSKTLLEKLDRLDALEGLDEENQLTLF